jgi:dTMP kinase
MFITFEGIEGSGKSTQVKRLAAELRQKGFDVLETREPGGTAIGDQIRKVLLNPHHTAIVPRCELLLYAAARAQHVEELIVPALNQKKIVLCDRFVDAMVAYQGFGRGIDRAVLSDLNCLTLKDLIIDRTFLLDLPVEEGLARARRRDAAAPKAQRENRIENEDNGFHHQVRRGYLDIAAADPRRFITLDARKDPDGLQAEIWHHVMEWVRK